MPYLPCHYLYISFISCTYWVPTISVLNLTIFPLLLKPAAQKEKMDWNYSTRVLGYVLPWLMFLWCYGIFRCSILLRVILVFRDIIYVIIILYSWQLIICEHFWSYVWNNWSWVMHTMSTWFWHKNRVWQCATTCSVIGSRFHPGPHGARGAEVLCIYTGKPSHCKWGRGTAYLPRKP
jgi:hypothetical protein